MSGMDTVDALEIDQDSIVQIRATLDHVGYDAAQQALRPDYFTSPFPNYEDLLRLLPVVDRPIAIALRLLALGLPEPFNDVEQFLGRDFVEAGLVCGLLQYQESSMSLKTNGYSVISLVGNYFLVSINRYYPTFDPKNADVYMGPDSFALAHEIARRRSLIPAAGSALDLCTGSGIAGLTASKVSPSLSWAGIDLSPQAVVAANFNAELNGFRSRYSAVQSDLYAAVDGLTFDFVVANPPFIPVPAGLDFPLYGAGGEDGLSVLAPLLEQLARQLTVDGSGLIYAEGIGDAKNLFVERLLDPILASGRDVEITINSASTIDNALYTIGVMLSKQRPSRLPEIVRWKELFERLGCDLFAKLFIQVTPGSGRLTKKWICPDPHRLASLITSEQRGEERS
jgi:hypothetical protein